MILNAKTVISKVNRANSKIDYPKNADLEPHLYAEHWSWRQSPAKRGSWVGVDDRGREWFVKMTGSFNALRERVFDHLAQEIGLSCQTCVFLTLPQDSEPIKNAPDAELHQGAIALIQPHAGKPCCAACPYAPWFELQDEPSSWLRFLAQLGIDQATNLLVGDVLGYVCGANERHEFFFSAKHKVFLIDNEYTLVGSPDLRGAIEFVNSLCVDAKDRRLAAEILVPKLDLLGSIPDATLKAFTEHPREYKIRRKYPIPRNLPRFRLAARRLAIQLRAWSS